MNSVAIVKFNSLNENQSNELYRLRHAVFFERLNWEVNSELGMEKDQFDAEESVYLLAHSEEKIIGCMRLIPTTKPYMLKEIFPELLNGQAAPCEPETWEVSRFASVATGAKNTNFGFAEITKSLIKKGVQFAIDNGIKRYVLVTSVAVERLLVKLGINIYRIGPPILIGEVMSVACIVTNDRETVTALFGCNHLIAKKIAT